MHKTTTAVLLFFSVLVVGFGLIAAVALRPVRRARSSPLTAQERLPDHTLDTVSSDPRHPKLSPAGRVAAVFASAFGLVALGVSWATLHSLISDYRNGQLPELALIPVILLIPAIIDFVVVWLLIKLRRHYVLAQRGRLTPGIVVAYGIAGTPRLGQLVPTIYDFSPTGGAVMRGCALLSNYSSASPFFKTTIGSAVDVFYLFDRPGCNGLRLALLWEV